MSRLLIRHLIPASHPIFGGWRKLEDSDTIAAGDQTACASTLLSIENPEQWHDIDPADIGLTVKAACDEPRTPGEDDTDMDGAERLFRRKPVTAGRQRTGEHTLGD